MTGSLALGISLLSLIASIYAVNRSRNPRLKLSAADPVFRTDPTTVEAVVRRMKTIEEDGLRKLQGDGSEEEKS